MRFVALDLMAFGPFTDVSIDLTGGHFGLHLLYGPNEAGKSSTLRAITDFLYGIPVRTDDDFIHAYGTLRIGGVLENQRGERLHAIRRKANQGTLRDATETQAIDDAQWSRFIGDVTREWFTSMFGIDHETLRIGGEAIAKGGGKTGEAIFAGASGILGLSESQTALRERVDAILSSSGRRGTLHELTVQYKKTRDEQRSMSASAEQWSRANDELHANETKLEGIKSNLDEVHSQIAIRNRLRTAVPLAGRWNEVQRQLQEHADCPVLDDDFSTDASKRLARKASLQSRKKQLVQRRESLDRELHKLGGEEHVLALEDRIGELVVRSGEYSKAQSDLPGLQNSLQNEEHAAQEILRDMGRAPDLAALDALRLPRHQQVRIQTLAGNYATLMEQLRSASSQLERAKVRRHQLPSLEENSTDAERVQRLADTIDHLQRLVAREPQRENLIQATQDEALAIANEAARLKIDLDASPPFESRSLPAMSELETQQSVWQSLQDDTKEAASDLSRLSRDLKEIERQRHNLHRTHDIPAREDLHRMQRERDAVWDRVRTQMGQGLTEDSPLVSQYGQLSLSVDRIVERMLDAAKELAAREQLEEQQRLVSEQIDSARAEAQRTQEHFREWNENWQRLWQGWVDPPGTPSEMREWLARALGLQQRIESRLRQVRELERIDDELNRQRAPSQQLLFSMDPSISDAMSALQLLESARAIHRRHAEEWQRSERLDEQRRELEESILEAQTEVDQARKGLEEWRSQWRSDMESLGLASDALPGQAMEVISQLSELTGKWKTIQGLQKRIEGIERDAAKFVEELHALSASLGMTTEFTSVQSCVKEISNQLAAARQRRQHRQSLEEQIQSNADDQESLDREWEELESELGAMVCAAQCGDENQLVQIGERSRQKKEWQRNDRQLRSELAAIAQGDSIESLAQQALDIDALRIDQDIRDLELQRKELGDQREALIRDEERLRQSIANLDHHGRASELATQAQGLAASMESQFEELVALRWASAVLTEGIERFRKKNQAPMLQAASVAFCGMTRGRYQGLRVDLDDDGNPVLVGIRSGEARDVVHVSQMSDGTRDQLYLSLRIAALQEWNTRHEPMPLIVDDILVHFDDDRSRATLEQLARLSDQTQIIFLTHHEHLVELASRAVDASKLFVHRFAS